MCHVYLYAYVCRKDIHVCLCVYMPPFCVCLCVRVCVCARTNKLLKMEAILYISA